jgi:flavin-dependent dehydrogenase
MMKKYDLIVVGGGISGVAAAVSAAREGLKVLLLEKFGSLGGAMSNSLVYPFMRHVVRGDSGKVTSAGIFTEMKERREKYNDLSWETFKFVFDDMVSEAGVDVLFHTTAFEVKTEGRYLKSVKVATKSGVMEFEGDFFIDASGDGELIAMAGCEYQLGRESDGFCQPMTTCFRLSVPPNTR